MKLYLNLNNNEDISIHELFPGYDIKDCSTISHTIKQQEKRIHGNRIEELVPCK
jgi:hypothetical protein